MHYAAILMMGLMMTSQIMKSAGFTKTQKPLYLHNETFFLQIKKFMNYTSSAGLWQIYNSCVVELTFEQTTSVNMVDATKQIILSQEKWVDRDDQKKCYIQFAFSILPFSLQFLSDKR